MEKRKIILFLLYSVLIILTLFKFANADLSAELGKISGNWITAGLYPTTADLRRNAQTFNLSENQQLTGIDIGYILITNNPGNLNFSVRKNGVTGNILSSIIYAQSDINTTVINRLRFSAPVTLETGYQYVITFTADDAPAQNNLYELRTSNNDDNYPFGSSMQFYSGTWVNDTEGDDIWGNLTFISFSPSPALNIYSDLVNGTVTTLDKKTWFFNGTSTNNSNIYSCSFLNNSVINETKANIDLSVQQNFTFNFFSSGEWFNFSINCSNENASDIDSALYYVDTVLSNYSIFSPLNGSTYYDSADISINFTVNDTNIYSILYNISKVDRNVLVLKYSIGMTGITGTGYSVFNISNSTDWGTGTFNYSLQVWENHNPLTDPSLFTEYSVYKNTTTVLYSSGSRSYSVSVINSNATITTTTKDLKQYFSFNPNKKGIEYQYLLKSDSKLDYIENSIYKGHFVIWDYKRYIDFQCSDKVRIERLSDYEYYVYTPCIDFETTGNLNYQIVTGSFSIISEPDLTYAYLIELINKTEEGNQLTFSISGGINMIAVMILLTLFVVLTIATPHKWLLFFVGLIMIWFSFLFGGLLNSSFIDSGNYLFYKTGTFIFLFLGILITFIGITLALIARLNMKKQKGIKFYSDNKKGKERGS